MTGDGRTDDAALVARLKAGDASAYETLHRLHAPRLFNLACRMLGSAADAEDAVQETFLLVFRKVGAFRGESSVGTWLYRLGMNLCIDRLRSRAAGEARRTRPVDADPIPAPSGEDEMVLTRLDLERAIAELPEGCRAAFLLHDVEGFDHREVGAILGVSDGTSKSQVHKARLRLREHLLRRARPAAGGAAGGGNVAGAAGDGPASRRR
jgi:RNA polymerase sigma-70 factor (ECF subfamily)